MGVMRQIGKNIVDAGKCVGHKTVEIADATKLSAKIADEERYINKLYQEIGKDYFEKNKGDTSSEYYPHMYKIEYSLQKIEELKLEKQEVKNEKICPNCGKKVKNNSAFCDACGKPLFDINTDNFDD